MAPSSRKSTSSRNEQNAVNRSVYFSLRQSGLIKDVADASYGGNFSRAMLGRFFEVDELALLPVFLQPRLAAAAQRAGLSNRDYVVKVLSEHALALPDVPAAAAASKKGSPK